MERQSVFMTVTFYILLTALLLRLGVFLALRLYHSGLSMLSFRYIAVSHIGMPCDAMSIAEISLSCCPAMAGWLAAILLSVAGKVGCATDIIQEIPENPDTPSPVFKRRICDQLSPPS